MIFTIKKYIVNVFKYHCFNKFKDSYKLNIIYEFYSRLTYFCYNYINYFPENKNESEINLGIRFCFIVCPK